MWSEELITMMENYHTKKFGFIRTTSFHDFVMRSQLFFQREYNPLSLLYIKYKFPIYTKATARMIILRSFVSGNQLSTKIVIKTEV